MDNDENQPKKSNHVCICNMCGNDINTKAEQIISPKVEAEIQKFKKTFLEQQPSNILSF